MSLVVITGATGTQGGSVARQLAKNPAWKVRGLTRNAQSTKARELKTLGVEMVTADLNDARTLPEAFEGATAIFCVTFFWDIATTEGIDAATKGELQQFINVVQVAAKLPTLRHLVLSVMPNCETLSGGILPCPHWDAKARGGEYVKRELPQLAAKTTYVWMGWYVDNLAGQPLMKPQPYLGKYIIAQPSKPDAIVPVAGVVEVNTGITVQSILAQPEKTHGKYVPKLTDLISWTAIAEGWSKYTGETAVYAEISDSEFEKLVGPSFGPEIARQFRFSEEYPDWYTYHPEDTLSLKDLGVGEEVLGFYKGLEYFKSQIQP
ncbi:hypothetical protein ASPVEDRAFT_84875 [Aspergillus versicolor CBS 583.65]|uniref:NmrA-like domain-containing protein n=1 Tax=Aspergillus versicolor CBS 583.65 TaxID=1036611 RepID=A0A1L9PPH4_ASPVE|nr:uncharacterized protein ASPVEDRAFT_84875 [Aspergillus versicolor CBS 583.65]OJJ03428.1 hypothetical protein ASPVEDRAFT_84875 [Aspergillus versicolor CBS 583.65]